MTFIKSFKRLFLLTALGTTVVISSCKKDDDGVTPPPPAPVTVASYVAADTSFSLLLTAVKKAGLAATLSGAGSFTVFAPNNSAFRLAGFPTDASINALDTATIKAIILYHTLGANVPASAVPASDTVKTLNGKNLFASSNGNGVFLNGIRVITPNVTVSNGTIHVIGNVLIPPTSSIAQIVIASASAPTPEFSILLAAVVRTGLAGVLSGAGKYTVFAPTNAAFSTLPAPFNTASSIAAIGSADSIVLRRIVLAHVLGTNVFAGDLTAITTPQNTANPLASVSPQQTLTFSGTGNTSLKITTSSATVSTIITSSSSLFNITATNGVIHAINKVLL